MSNTKEPCLSSFYFINGELYGDTIKVSDGERNNDYIIIFSNNEFLPISCGKFQLSDFVNKIMDH